MTTLRDELIKIGAKVVRHIRHVVFQMAEMALPRKLFASILDRIKRRRPPAVGAQWLMPQPKERPVIRERARANAARKSPGPFSWRRQEQDTDDEASPGARFTAKYASCA